MRAPDDSAADIRTPGQWQAEIAAAEGRRAATTAALERVVAERRALAPAAAGGDRVAAARIEWLNIRSGEIVLELDGIAVRKDVASERLAEALECCARGGEPARRPEAATLRKAIEAEDKQADKMMAGLRAALAARRALVRRLDGTGQGNEQLQNPGRLLAAAIFHGLQEYLPLPRAPDRLLAPLTLADAIALRAEPAPTKDQERAA